MRATALALILALGAAPALAQSTPEASPGVEGSPTPQVVQEAALEISPELRALYDAMRLHGIVEVMADEGDAYAEDLASGMFAEGRVPASWTDAVAEIYDPARMEAEVLASLEASLAGEDVAAMTAFFLAEPGASIAELELAARQALLDDDVEQAAKEAAAVAMADDDPRLDLIKRYAEANDLIETNVAGALNSNFAYFMGLMDGGATDPGLSEGDVLADVRSQEGQVRADTTEWVYSFLLMAYAPATDEDIESLIAFSETEPGQALNTAVFTAFDRLFEDVSHSLGLASARMLTTQDL